MSDPSSIREKTQYINSSPAIYGTIAEIGAGQETARWFFRTRGASNTLAKTMSAYDMSFSDSIYGREESGRYVVESRLKRMLDHEYALLEERLRASRGDTTCFFAFANTVAARSRRTGRMGHGWIGLRWQAAPLQPPNEIRMHIRMLDKRNTLQQEALGIVGVNLIFGAFYYGQNPKKLIEQLTEDLEEHRVEIDFITFSGPLFEGIDNRLMGFHLLTAGLTQAITFDESGQPVQPAELIYGKNVLLFRAHFRLLTLYHKELFDCARRQFEEELGSGESIIEIAEIPEPYLPSGDAEAQEQDFLRRIDILSSEKHAALFTRIPEIFRLQRFLEENHCQKPRLLIPREMLDSLFDESNYRELRGGLLEAFGRLFREDFCIYVCPAVENETVLDTSNYRAPSHLQSFYEYLMERRWIQGTRCLNYENLAIHGKEIIEKIQAGDNSWKSKVPDRVRDLIESKNYFREPRAAKSK